MYLWCWSRRWEWGPRGSCHGLCSCQSVITVASRLVVFWYAFLSLYTLYPQFSIRTYQISFMLYFQICFIWECHQPPCFTFTPTLPIIIPNLHHRCIYIFWFERHIEHTSISRPAGPAFYRIITGL